MKKLFLTLFLICGITTAAHATLVSINFNDLSAGDVLTDQYSSLGVDFALLDAPSGYQAGPGVIAINESTYVPAMGLAITPGDNMRDPFYDIELSFASSIDYFSILALDADEPVTVSGYFNEIEISSQYYAPGSDTQVWTISLGEIGSGVFFDKIIIDIVKGNDNETGYAGGPEIFDDLEFNEVPEPATIVLFGIGILGLLKVNRKKKIT